MIFVVDCFNWFHYFIPFLFGGDKIELWQNGGGNALQRETNSDKKYIRNTQHLYSHQNPPESISSYTPSRLSILNFQRTGTIWCCLRTLFNYCSVPLIPPLFPLLNFLLPNKFYKLFITRMFLCQDISHGTMLNGTVIII